MQNNAHLHKPHQHRQRQQLGLALLLALLAAILFPFEWLGARWPAFGRALDSIFASEISHMLGHASLFGLLGLWALAIFPALRQRPRLYAGLLLGAGIGQELFQLLFKQRRPAFDDGRDLLIDLLGLLLAFGLARCWQRYSSSL